MLLPDAKRTGRKVRRERDAHFPIRNRGKIAVAPKLRTAGSRHAGKYGMAADRKILIIKLDIKFPCGHTITLLGYEKGDPIEPSCDCMKPRFGTGCSSQEMSHEPEINNPDRLIPDQFGHLQKGQND